MKAYVIASQADRGLDAVALADVPRPAAGPGRVLVKVHAVGLNPVDCKLADHGDPAWTYPHTLGLDVAGEIVEVGSGVEDAWKPGMRVSGHGDLRLDGCFAEYVTAPTYELALIPSDVSYTDAAALLCGAMTAYQAINRKPNLNMVRTALIHGGSGAVGGIAVQLAKMHGVRVLTTCSTAKIGEVERLGPDAIIDYRAEDVDERVRALTDGLGVDLVVDTVGAAEAERDLDRLAYNGQLVTVVGAPRFDPAALFARALSVDGVNLGGAHASEDPYQKADLGTMASDLLQMASQGSLDPLVERVLPFDGLVEGLRALARHEVAGKLVASLDD